MTTNTEYLPQSEGADWFLVIDPKEGIVHHAYSADLGRSFGHEHIKDAQMEGEATAKRWVVKPAYAALDMEHKWGCRANAFGSCTCGAGARQAQAKADALDAQRYRWLRRNIGVQRTGEGEGPVSPYLLMRTPATNSVADETDAACDAAIAAQSAQKNGG